MDVRFSTTWCCNNTYARYDKPNFCQTLIPHVKRFTLQYALLQNDTTKLTSWSPWTLVYIEHCVMNEPLILSNLKNHNDCVKNLIIRWLSIRRNLQPRYHDGKLDWPFNRDEWDYHSKFPRVWPKLSLGFSGLNHSYLRFFLWFLMIHLSI